MNDLILFFDGCHKIYYADRNDFETVQKMRGYDYEVIDGDFEDNLNGLWAQSCMLRFVQPADLDRNKPEVEQGHDELPDDFIMKLENYYGGHVNA